ncbi:MAG: hypothetical protein LBH25_04520 [Fibromonadaceae bacterium]|jgi:hypothetical protein|nr:hypothetical protein [Fibromonadaceae bacterium]
MKQKSILYFAFLGISVAILFVACSNGDSSKEPSSFFVTDIAWYNSSQTEFVITTAEALAGLAELVNNGNDFAGKSIKLGADIMLNDTANWQKWESNPPKNKWMPIGNYDNPFEGKGFIVSGVYVSNLDDNQGFFGYIHCGGTIERLGVTASYVEGKNNVGGFVGTMMYGWSISHFMYNSYYDMKTSGQSDDEGKGEGKTTAEMKQRATFVNWDFDDIWSINSAINNGYPYLLNTIMATQ